MIEYQTAQQAQTARIKAKRNELALSALRSAVVCLAVALGVLAGAWLGHWLSLIHI